MGRVLTIHAPAKLNLFLEVLGRRPDGFHEIRTVMHPIDLKDRLTFRARPRKIEIEGDGVEFGDRNLVRRAAGAISERAGRALGARIHVRKSIPAGSGLGGGSSDAAAVLRGIAELHRLGWGDEILAEVGAQIGSDVPFFLQRETALCTGRGEYVTPLRPRPTLHFVLVDPGFPLATRSVYDRFKPPLTVRGKDARSFLRTWAGGDVRKLGRSLFNRLESTVFALAPALGRLKDRIATMKPHGVLLTGSGSFLYALCSDREEARELAGRVRRETGHRTRVVRTARGGLIERRM